MNVEDVENFELSFGQLAKLGNDFVLNQLIYDKIEQFHFLYLTRHELRHTSILHMVFQLIF